MGVNRAGPAGDLALCSLMFALAASDVVIRELNNRVSSEPIQLLFSLFVAVACLAMALLAWRVPHLARFARLGRSLVPVSWVLALWLSAGKMPDQAWSQGGISQLWVAIAAAVTSAMAIFAWRCMRVESWVRLRRAMVVSLTLFVASPWAIGAYAGNQRDWPPSTREGPTGRVVTLVLLLDELNASAVGPIRAELDRAGLVSAVASVPSVGDKTADVVPSVFAGKIFRDAKPCTPTAVCDGTNVLDFARLRASRPDVDVVGFFQPYCAIKGLRSCYRGTVRFAALDRMRWACGLWRRTGWRIGVDQQQCDENTVRAWVEMVGETIDAAARAPALKQGGILFAHLPLPHPPGAQGVGTLQYHYQSNLSRAAELLRGMLKSARNAGLEPRLLIFSDHPLRQSHWCRALPVYSQHGCKPDPELIDSRVPIIAAGREPPDLADLTSNLDVFGIVDKLR